MLKSYNLNLLFMISFSVQFLQWKFEVGSPQKIDMAATFMPSFFIETNSVSQRFSMGTCSRLDEKVLSIFLPKSISRIFLYRSLQIDVGGFLQYAGRSVTDN